MKAFNLLVIFILSAFLAGLLINFNLITLGVAVILVFLPVMFMNPSFYFVVFILTRPLMDITASITPVKGVNLAAIATIFFVIVCGPVLLSKNNRKIISDSRFLMNFNKIFILFLLYCFFPLYNSKELTFSLSDFPRQLSILVAINYASVYFSQQKKKLKLLWLIVISAMVPLAFGLYQFIFKKGMPELGFNRILGTFVHPNVYSEYLLLIFFVLFYIFSNYKIGFFLKIFCYLVFTLVIMELFLTFTRGTWIALAASVMVFTILRSKFLQIIKYSFFVILVLALLFPVLQKRFSDIEDNKPGQLSSWQWRLQQWRQTTDALSQHPLIGNGMGMHERQFKMMAHNDYLRITYETGILGPMIYLSILLYILFSALKKVFQARERLKLNQYKISLALILSIITMSVVDNLARSTFIVLYFFVVIGYFLETRRNYENPASK